MSSDTNHQIKRLKEFLLKKGIEQSPTILVTTKLQPKNLFQGENSITTIEQEHEIGQEQAQEQDIQIEISVEQMQAVEDQEDKAKNYPARKQFLVLHGEDDSIQKTPGKGFWRKVFSEQDLTKHFRRKKLTADTAVSLSCISGGIICISQNAQEEIEKQESFFLDGFDPKNLPVGFYLTRGTSKLIGGEIQFVKDDNGQEFMLCFATPSKIILENYQDQIKQHNQEHPENKISTHDFFARPYLLTLKEKQTASSSFTFSEKEYQLVLAKFQNELATLKKEKLIAENFNLMNSINLLTFDKNNLYQLLRSKLNSYQIYTFLTTLTYIEHRSAVHFANIKQNFLEEGNWEKYVSLEYLEVMYEISQLPEDQFRWWDHFSSQHLAKQGPSDGLELFATFKAFVKDLESFWLQVYGEETPLVLPECHNIPTNNLITSLNLISNLIKNSFNPKEQLEQLSRKGIGNLAVAQYHSSEASYLSGPSYSLSAPKLCSPFLFTGANKSQIRKMKLVPFRMQEIDYLAFQEHLEKEESEEFILIDRTSSAVSTKIDLQPLQENSEYKALSQVLAIIENSFFSILYSPDENDRLGYVPEFSKVIQFFEQLKIPLRNFYYLKKNYSFEHLTVPICRLCATALKNGVNSTILINYMQKLFEHPKAEILLNMINNISLQSKNNFILTEGSDGLRNQLCPIEILDSLCIVNDLDSQQVIKERGVQLQKEMDAFSSKHPGTKFNSSLLKILVNIDEIKGNGDLIEEIYSIPESEREKIGETLSHLEHKINWQILPNKTQAGVGISSKRLNAVELKNLIRNLKDNQREVISYPLIKEYILKHRQLTEEDKEMIVNLNSSLFQTHVTITYSTEFSLIPGEIGEVTKKLAVKNSAIVEKFLPIIGKMLEIGTELELSDFVEKVREKIQNPRQNTIEGKFIKVIFNQELIKKYCSDDLEVQAEAIVETIEKGISLGLPFSLLPQIKEFQEKVWYPIAQQTHSIFQGISKCLTALKFSPEVIEEVEKNLLNQTNFVFENEQYQFKKEEKPGLLESYRKLLTFNLKIALYANSLVSYCENGWSDSKNIANLVYQKLGDQFVDLTEEIAEFFMGFQDLSPSNFPSFSKVMNYLQTSGIPSNKQLKSVSVLLQHQKLRKPDYYDQEELKIILSIIGEKSLEAPQVESLLEAFDSVVKINSKSLNILILKLLTKEDKAKEISQVTNNIKNIFTTKEYAKLSTELMKFEIEGDDIYELLQNIYSEATGTERQHELGNILVKILQKKNLQKTTISLKEELKDLHSTLLKLDSSIYLEILNLFKNFPYPDLFQFKEILGEIPYQLNNIRERIINYERNPYGSREKRTIIDYDRSRISVFLRRLTQANSPLFIPGQDARIIEQLQSDCSFVIQQGKDHAQKLSHAQLREALLDIKNKIVQYPPSLSENELYLLKLEALSLIVEVIYRTTSNMPNSTQIMDAILQTKFNLGLGLQINTGEGKSYISQLLGGIKWVEGYAVNMFTSNPNLAKRDFKEAEYFWNYLGIKTQYIDKTSNDIDYQEGKIFYSTPGDYALWHSAQISQGFNPTHKKKKAGIFDEADQIFYNASTKSNFSVIWQTLPQKILYEFYQTINDFVDENYQILIELKSNERLEQEKLISLANQLRQKLAKLPLGEAAYQDFMKPEADPQIFINWLSAAITARQLEAQEQLYKTAVRPGDPPKQIIQLLDAEMVVLEKAAFSGGVHQLLAARLQTKERKANPGVETIPYEIKSESRITDSSTDFNVVKSMDWVGGITGTFGSSALRTEAEKRFGIRIIKTPPHKKDQKQYLATLFADNAKKQRLAIYKTLVSPTKVSRKIKQVHGAKMLVWSSIAKCVTAVDQITKELTLNKEKVPTTILRVSGGRYFKTVWNGNSITDRETPIEKEEFDQLALNMDGGMLGENPKKNTFIVATQEMGRGVNIKNLEQVVLADYYVGERIEEQIKGRTGRYGAWGEVVPIYNWEEIDKEYRLQFPEEAKAYKQGKYQNWKFLGHHFSLTRNKRLKILQQLRNRAENIEATKIIRSNIFSELTRELQDNIDQLIINLNQDKGINAAEITKELTHLKKKLIENFELVEKQTLEIVGSNCKTPLICEQYTNCAKDLLHMHLLKNLENTKIPGELIENLIIKPAHKNLNPFKHFQVLSYHHDHPLYLLEQMKLVWQKSLKVENLDTLMPQFILTMQKIFNHPSKIQEKLFSLQEEEILKKTNSFFSEIFSKLPLTSPAREKLANQRRACFNGIILPGMPINTIIRKNLNKLTNANSSQNSTIILQGVIKEIAQLKQNELEYFLGHFTTGNLKLDGQLAALHLQKKEKIITELHQAVKAYTRFKPKCNLESFLQQRMSHSLPSKSYFNEKLEISQEEKCKHHLHF